MNMRFIMIDQLLRAGFVLLLALLTGTRAVAAGAPARPNIVLFLSDDHGVDFVGCYGNAAVHTPHIDALARQGTRYDRVFAASPTCSPSRAAMFTGMYPLRNGTMGNHTDCRPDVKSLPSYLKPLGYRVVAANKTDVRPPSVFDWEALPATLPKDPKFNRRYRFEGLDTSKIDAFLAAHTKEHPDQPLCLLIGESSPHVLWEQNHDFDPSTLPIPPYMVDTPKTRAALANYYQEIATADRRLGEVMESLRRHGLEQKTLLIYSSDQGAEWPHAKWTCYDTGLRVPFIARWPGMIKPGATNDALISLIDVMPTLVELAGGTSEASIDGRSFKDVLIDAAARHDRYIFASHTGDGDMNVFPQRCAGDGRFKYILNLHPERKWTTHFTKVEGIPNSHREVYATWEEKAKSDPAAAKLLKTIEWHPAEELYDTQSDPYELNNIAGDARQAEKLNELRGRLRAWLESAKDEDALAAMKIP
jgi:arylsulfatase A-like enzyme